MEAAAVVGSNEQLSSSSMPPSALDGGSSAELEGAALSSLSPFAGEEDAAEEVDSVPVSPGTVAVLDTAVLVVVVSFPSMLCVSVVCPGVVDVVLQKLLLEAPSNWYTLLQAD